MSGSLPFPSPFLRDEREPGHPATVLTIAHPAGSHNGGTLTFGTDNLLYWSVGDNVDNMTAQSTTRLTGKILRLNVLLSCGALHYCIPASNPFAASTRYPRGIWLWGLRNPPADDGRPPALLDLDR